MGRVLPAATIATLVVYFGASASQAGVRADATPPRIQALPSSGSAGKTVRLRARAYDNGRELQLEAFVFRGTTRVFRWRSSFLKAIPATRLLYYYVEWRLPRPTRGVYRFCMRAYDRAGNRSGTSCSTLRVS
jgi:hypothetical protein